MKIDWGVLASIAAVFSTLVAIAALIYQIRASRFSVEVETVMQLNDQFEGAPFCEIRCRAARFLAVRFLKEPVAQDESGRRAVLQILDFFAMVAFLHKRRALGTETVWYTFSSWLLPYYRLAKDQIAEVKNGREPLAYRGLEQLHKEVEQFERRQRAKPGTVGSEPAAGSDPTASSREFLRDEIRLCKNPDHQRLLALLDAAGAPSPAG